MVDSSGTAYPKTSVRDLYVELGIPLEKLVLGKPVAEKEANSGYVIGSSRLRLTAGS